MYANDKATCLLFRVATAVAVAVVCSCFDTSKIENEDCKSDDDCLSSQECIKTDYQRGIPDDLGWCRPKGEGCAVGAQPGCACRINGQTLECETGSYANNIIVSENDIAQSSACICIFEPDESGSSGEMTGSTG